MAGIMSKIKTHRPNSNPKPMVTDFGLRKISNQNFSKMIAIPKTALANCGCKEATSANVKLVQDNGEKYIKLTPVCQIEGEEKENE